MNQLVQQIKQELWSIKNVLDAGPFRNHGEGEYDEEKDRIVFIRDAGDYSSVGKPFWTLSDSQDRSFVHYGSRYLEQRRLKELEAENRKLRRYYYLQ